MSNLVPGYPAINPQEVAVVPPAGSLEEAAATFEGYASGAVTLGGTLTTNDTLTITINGHGVTHTVNTGTDTSLSVLATNFASDLNGDSTDAAIISASASGDVITITALTKGTVGVYSLAVSHSAGASETITASASELEFTPTNVIVPNQTFQYMFANGLTKTFYKNVPANVNPEDASAMRTASLVY